MNNEAEAWQVSMSLRLKSVGGDKLFINFA